MKYYTIEEAIKKAEKEKSGFYRETNLTFNRGMYNAIRMFFGYQGKFYYFEDKNEEPDIKSGMTYKGLRHYRAKQ